MAQHVMFADLGRDLTNAVDDGRWQLVALVVAYALVVHLTNRILITAPDGYNLIERVAEERAELALAGSDADGKRSPDDEARCAPIEALLHEATSGIAVKRRKRWRLRPFATLARVLSGRRYLHAAERLRMNYISPSVDLVRFDAIVMSNRLHDLDSTRAERLRAELLGWIDNVKKSLGSKSVDVEAGGLAVIVSEARRLSYEVENARLERAAESQRRVTWLTLVGLMFILAFGVAGRRQLMLFGALGGLLAPLTTVWQGHGGDAKDRKGKADAGAEYVTSWGALVLGPVAGALAAYGGLLLVSFLANEQLNVLGEVFRANSWTEPTTSFAFGLALLFGFSGGLFGRIALQASNQVLPPGSAAATMAPPPGSDTQARRLPDQLHDGPSGGQHPPVTVPHGGHGHVATEATAGTAAPMAAEIGTVLAAVTEAAASDTAANSDSQGEHDGGATGDAQ